MSLAPVLGDSKRSSMVETNLPPLHSETGSPGSKSGEVFTSSSGSSWHKRAQHRLRSRSSKRDAKSAGSPVEEVVGCVRTIFELLEIFGMTKRGTSTQLGKKVDLAYNRTVEHWMAASIALGPGGWMYYAKWTFANFFHTHSYEQWDSPPVAPDGLPARYCYSQLAAGVAGRYALRLARGPSKSSFLASVLQLKKGCPRPAKDLVQLQVTKTMKALATRRVIPREHDLVTGWADLLEIEEAGLDEHWTGLSVENIIWHLRRTVEELFNDSHYGNNDKFIPYFPSTSASIENKVDEGGAFRSIRNFATSAGLLRPESLISIRESYVPCTLEQESIGAPRIPTPVYGVDLTTLEHTFGDLYERTVKSALSSRNLVKPVGLPEALKIRVITKGVASRGFVLKPLQKWMWKTLRKNPVFELIGKPVDSWYIQRRLGARKKEGEGYLSGDYSAATDNLASYVSETIATAIADLGGLTDDERKLFLEALTRHELVDSEGTHLQQWGQLMGSVVSFPVLCIANAAFCRWALELDYRKKMRLSQTSLMVNGDDCAMRCTREGLRFWKTITTFGGLEPSIGKYFFSPEFVQINSENFVRSDDGELEYDPFCEKVRLSHFLPSRYVNLGLLHGLKRSAGKQGVDVVSKKGETVGVRARDFVKSLPPQLVVAGWKRFLRANQDLLTTVHIPWYIPEQLGGVGLPIIYDNLPQVDIDVPKVPLFGPSELDMRLAMRIVEKPEKYTVGRVPTVSSWNVHRVAMRRLRNLRTDNLLPSQAVQDTFDRVYGSLVVDSMFQIEDVFLGKEGSNQRLGALRQNERSWQRVLHDGRLPPAPSLAWLERARVVEPLPQFIVDSLHELQ